MQFLRSVCYNSFQVPHCLIRFFTNRPKSVILFYSEVFFSQPSFSEFPIFELYKKLLYTFPYILLQKNGFFQLLWNFPVHSNSVQALVHTPHYMRIPFLKYFVLIPVRHFVLHLHKYYCHSVLVYCIPAHPPILLRFLHIHRSLLKPQTHQLSCICS